MAYPPQPPQPQPYQPEPWDGAQGQAAPQGYDPPQPPAPQHPAYGTPQNPTYGAPQHPDGAPQNPAYGTAQNPDYDTPQHAGYGTAQHPGYGTPQPPVWGPPQHPAYLSQQDPSQGWPPAAQSGNGPSHPQPDYTTPPRGSAAPGYSPSPTTSGHHWGPPPSQPTTPQPTGWDPQPGQTTTPQPAWDPQPRQTAATQHGYGLPPGQTATNQPGYGSPSPHAAATQPAYSLLPGQTAPAQQGYGNPPYAGQPGGGPFQQPPGYAPVPATRKGNSGLIIGLAIGLAVILLGGGAVGAFLYLNAPGPTTPVALPSDDPATSPPSQRPEPTDPPASATPDPTTPDPTTTPSSKPTSSASASTQVQPGSPLTHSEFKDWNFALGGVKFRADKVGGWTYPSCAPVDGEGSVLTRNKCESAVQLAYSAYSGHIKAVQLLMSFPSEQAAKTAATRLAKLTSNAVRWRQNATLTNYSYGKILSGASKNYVVVTIVTADRSARSLAPNFHAYLQTDQASYFLLRDKTITS